MYHPTVVSAAISKLSDHYAPHLPQGGLREYSVSEVDEWLARLATQYDEKGRQLRELSLEEQRFVLNELLMSKASFAYWAERYSYISLSGAGLGRMYPLWESQRLILAEIARVELAMYEGEWAGGILIALLKSRQLGGSTLAQSLIAHRATTQDNVFGLIAADDPTQSAYLFDMFERIVEHLPVFLHPTITEHVKNTEMKFDGGSNIWTGSGKSTRGVKGERGQIGRGKTLAVLHLSELSTWENTDQIEAALLPAMPEHIRSLGIFESSGRGRNNWWHRTWEDAITQVSRFTPVFIPWFAERTKYTRPAPSGWTPAETTLLHAKLCEASAPRWTHRSASLTRDQLYWYETTRAEHERKGKLGIFLENYSSNPDEAFQFSGKSIFPIEVLNRVQENQRPVLAVLEVASHVDLTAGPPGSSLSPEHLRPFDIPAGYGIRALTPDQVRTLPSLAGFLLVWEAPRRNQLYVISADVADGIGKDRSVVDVTRVGTVKEPEEQVAQFISSSIPPEDLAPIIDVVGRLYTGSDNQPAMVAIEVNNHGLATQAELTRHLGYDNLYVWQYEDTADPAKRMSTRIGWITSKRTRPLIVGRFVKLVRSGDYRINSFFTLEEMRDFMTLGDLADAEADPTNDTAYDDCIMTAAIGLYVCQTLQYEMGETVADQRRRHFEEHLRRQARAAKEAQPDFRNTDWSADEMDDYRGAYGDYDV